MLSLYFYTPVKPGVPPSRYHTDYRHWSAEYLWSMLHIMWQAIVTSKKVRRRVGQVSLDRKIERRNWGWLCHTLKKPFSRLVWHDLCGNPLEKRARGRPRETWRRSAEAERLQIRFSLGEITEISPWQKEIAGPCWRPMLRSSRRNSV